MKHLKTLYMKLHLNLLLEAVIEMACAIFEAGTVVLLLVAAYAFLTDWTKHGI